MRKPVIGSIQFGPKGDGVVSGTSTRIVPRVQTGADIVAKVLAIIDSERAKWLAQQWMPYESQQHTGAHACELIAAEVRREFGVKE